MSPSTPSTRQQRKLAYAAWVAVCLIWGTTYLGIRVSLETMPPALMGGLRWTIAGGLLALWLVLRGEKLPPPSRWGPLALLGFLMLVLGNGGVVFAEQWIPSGLTAVLVATSPFWMAGIEAFLPDGEKLRLSLVAGLVLGFSGIVLLVWPELTLGSSGDRHFLLGIVAVQIAAFGWSLGSSVLETAYAGRPHTGNDRSSDAGRRSDDGAGGHGPRRVGLAVLHDAVGDSPDVSRHHRRDWRVRGLLRTRCGTCRSPSCRCMRTSIRSSPSRSASWC